MKHMVEDDLELAVEVLKWVARLKRIAEDASEEDEILQTKVVSTREVSRSWKSWQDAIDADVQSLLEEKEALKLEEIKKKWLKKGALWRSSHPSWSSQSKLAPNGGKPNTAGSSVETTSP